MSKVNTHQPPSSRRGETNAQKSKNLVTFLVKDCAVTGKTACLRLSYNI